MSSFRSFVNNSPQPAGTRISVHNRKVLTSSGIASLDELIGGGIPSSSILLLKQDRFTGYSNLIFKYFIAQGVLQTGQELLVCSLDENPETIITQLMAKTQSKITPEDQKEFVPSLSGTGGTRSLGALRSTEFNPRNENMSIAWRYNRLPQNSNASAGKTINNSIYCHTFDLTKRIEEDDLKLSQIHLLDKDALDNADASSKKSYYSKLFDILAVKLKEECFSIHSAKPKLLRLAIHGIGSPFWEVGSYRHEFYRFVYKLKSIIREKHVVVYLATPAYLYNDFNGVSIHPNIRRIEHAVDAVIEVESFSGSVKNFEGDFTSDYSGLFHPLTLYQMDSIVESSRMKKVSLHSLGFKVRRKRFSIEPFILPPEKDESDSPSSSNILKKSSNVGCSDSNSSNTKSLDF